MQCLIVAHSLNDLFQESMDQIVDKMNDEMRERHRPSLLYKSNPVPSEQELSQFFR